LSPDHRTSSSFVQFDVKWALTPVSSAVLQPLGLVTRIPVRRHAYITSSPPGAPHPDIHPPEGYRRSGILPIKRPPGLSSPYCLPRVRYVAECCTFEFTSVDQHSSYSTLEHPPYRTLPKQIRKLPDRLSAHGNERNMERDRSRFQRVLSEGSRVFYRV